MAQDGATPTEYRLTSAEDVPERDPRTWKLEGSTDGKTWTSLDEHADEPLFAERHETRSYKIARPAMGRYFRLTFLPNPGITHFQVAEIQLEGVAPKKTAEVVFEDYTRTLDLRTAFAKVVYREAGVRFTREYFVSAPDEVFVSRLTADKPGSLSFAVTLDRPERFETTAPAGNELLMSGSLDDGRGGRGVSYAARLRVLCRGGSVAVDGNRLIVDGADEVLLLVAAATDFQGFAGRHLNDPIAATASDLDGVAKKSYDQLRAHNRPITRSTSTV